MPNDVTPPASSPEDKRTASGSQPDTDQPLDAKHQEMADSPILADLIEKLAPTDGAPSADNPPPADDTGEPVPPETPPADDPAAAPSDTTSTEPPAEPPSETRPPAEKPKVNVDDSYPTDTELGGYSSHSQKRIRQLVDARKRVEAENAKLLKALEEAKPAAEYRRELDETLTKHKIAPKAWDEWSSLGVLIQTDPEKAGPVLLALADSLGFKAEPGAPPAVGAVRLDADLTRFVKENDMTLEAAEAVQKTRRPYPQAPHPNQPPAPAAPRLEQDPLKQGAADIAAVNAEYAKRYPDQWESWAPEVMAEMAKYAGAAPRLWKQIARDSAERVVAKKASKQQPTSIDPVARSSGGRSISASGSLPKNRDEMAERIVQITSTKR